MARQDSKTISLAQGEPTADEATPESSARRKSKTISLAQPEAVAEEPEPEEAKPARRRKAV